MMPKGNRNSGRKIPSGKIPMPARRKKVRNTGGRKGNPYVKGRKKY